MQDEFDNSPHPTPTETADERATVAGLFDGLREARTAVDALVDGGFDSGRVSLVASNAAGEHDGGEAPSEVDPVVDADPIGSTERAAAGGGIGAAIGGVGGVLMGLGLLAIPGVGPALAAGPIVSGLLGAGIGGAAGSIVGALASSGMPEERAGALAEGVRRGGTLLIVETMPAAAARAEEILRRSGAVDIDERVELWRRTGWSRFDETAAPFTPDEIARERALRRGT